MKLNVELLRKVQAHIKEEPRRLIMSVWFQPFADRVTMDLQWESFSNHKIGLGMLPEPLVPPCGTIGCIRGWAHNLSGDKYSISSCYKGLNIPEHFESLLYRVDEWPYKFQESYRTTDSPAVRADITCRVIDDFIQRYEAIINRYWENPTDIYDYQHKRDVESPDQTLQ